MLWKTLKEKDKLVKREREGERKREREDIYKKEEGQRERDRREIKINRIRNRSCNRNQSGETVVDRHR